jgi:hypothetical protein
MRKWKNLAKFAREEGILGGNTYDFRKKRRRKLCFMAKIIHTGSPAPFTLAFYISAVLYVSTYRYSGDIKSWHSN